MKACRILPLLFLSLSGAASATQTICDFHAESGSVEYHLEFIADRTGERPGQIGLIQVNEPRGLRLSGFEVLAFDRYAEKIHLVYESPGGDGVMPSFTLEGAGEEVRMTVAGQQIVGVLYCDGA